MVIHPEARTTPQIRAEIKAATGLTQKALAEKYNVSEQTIRKWQRRAVTTDKSHCPDRLQTTLSAAQEGIVVELRVAKRNLKKALKIMSLDLFILISNTYLAWRMKVAASTYLLL